MTRRHVCGYCIRADTLVVALAAGPKLNTARLHTTLDRRHLLRGLDLRVLPLVLEELIPSLGGGVGELTLLEVLFGVISIRGTPSEQPQGTLK